ncbi:hypothetical protein BIW11_00652, partial [Tropilaelaps mercedesae]
MKECLYFDLSMSPAQRFVRDQCFAFAKTVTRDLANDIMVTACLREGIENLYFLGHFWKGENNIVRVLATDLVGLIRGLSELLEMCERYGEVDVTNWEQIAQLIQNELLTDTMSVLNEDDFTCGKIKYFVLDKVI